MTRIQNSGRQNAASCNENDGKSQCQAQRGDPHAAPAWLRGGKRQHQQGQRDHCRGVGGDNHGPHKGTRVRCGTQRIPAEAGDAWHCYYEDDADKQPAWVWSVHDGYNEPGLMTGA